jgi:hypothetical protein
MLPPMGAPSVCLYRTSERTNSIFVLLLQNKMSLFEAQLQETKGQLDRLREENSLLAGRNAVLEKVLALREEQLKQGGHASAPMDTIPLPVRVAFVTVSSTTTYNVWRLFCCLSWQLPGLHCLRLSSLHRDRINEVQVPSYRLSHASID